MAAHGGKWAVVTDAAAFATQCLGVLVERLPRWVASRSNRGDGSSPTHRVCNRRVDRPATWPPYQYIAVFRGYDWIDGVGTPDAAQRVLDSPGPSLVWSNRECHVVRRHHGDRMVGRDC